MAAAANRSHDGAADANVRHNNIQPASSRNGQPNHAIKNMGHDSMFSAKIDPVSRNAIWKEHCLKEDAQLKLSTEFSVNPNTLIYIPEKPNRYKPSVTLALDEIAEAKQLLAAICMSKDMDMVPPDKYEVPQTSAQEYGWCSRPLVETDPFFNFPHKGCAITKFAAAYEECMHRSPYARRNPVDQHVAKTSGIDYAHAGVNTSRIGSPSVASSAQASSINSRVAKNYIGNSKLPPLPPDTAAGATSAPAPASVAVPPLNANAATSNITAPAPPQAPTLSDQPIHNNN